jgi:fibronectin type 3 domain-containing protein
MLPALWLLQFYINNKERVMKKEFIALSILSILFSGCEQPTNEPDIISPGPAMTIRNESSYDLSDVTWSGIKFVSSGQTDLSKGTASKKETTEDTSGYIYLTRKDIGINLRTQGVWMADDSPVTITDNTLVVEVANESNMNTLSKIGLVSEINIEYDGRSVARNDTINISGDTVVNTAKQIQITIKSAGSGNLTLSGVEPVQLDGLDNSFSVTQPTRSEVTASTPLNIVITFTPSSPGAHSTAVTIKSNTPSGDFTFNISATGISPKPVIEIFNGDTGIAQNGTINMGTIALTQSGVVTVTVKNTGTEVLTITPGGIAKSGIDEGAFSFDSLPIGSISVNGTSTFTIRCTPVQAREYSASISIPNNDPARNPAVFLIQATGVQEYPVIELKHDETAVLHNGTVGFGLVQANQTKKITFSLKNTGIIALSLSENPAVASSSAQFTVSAPSKTTVLPGETISFEIDYTPANTQNNAAQITIPNNSAINPFVFTVTGSVAVPNTPEWVSASAISPSSIQITWIAATGATYYKVYRSTYDGSYVYIGDSSTTSYTDTTLNANTAYYYKVSSYSAGGESALSSFSSATTQALPVPGTPAGVSASALTSSSIQITWGSVTGATYYKVYRSTDDSAYAYINDSSTTSYTNAGLNGNTRYYYKVSAYGAGGEGALSTSTSAMTLPNTPAEVSASPVSSSSIQITWNTVDGASYYKVYRSTSDGDYTFINDSSTASYTDTSLSSNTRYYYKVSAYGSGGESALSAFTSALTVPDAPTGLSVSALSSSSIQITWDAITGTSYYKVYRSTYDGDYVFIDNSSAASYTDTGLSASTRYYYKVSAYSAAGESALSSSASTQPVPGVPAGVSLSPLSGAIQVTWNTVSGASSYKVYLSTGTTPPTEASYTVTGLSTTITGLTNDTPYYVWVQAVNMGGSSPLSARESITLTLSAPAAPTLTAGNGSITASWSAVTMATSYKVYLSIETTPPTEASYAGTALSTTITGLVNETPYYVWVQAVNAGGSSSLSARGSITLTLSAPTVPTLTAGNGSITASWTAVTMATSYKVYLSTETTPPAEVSYTGTALSTTITGLVNETPYYVWVQAVNAGGSSSLSARGSITLTLSAPATPTLTAGNGRLTVTWATVDMAASYKVYRSTTTTPPAEPSYTGTGLSTILTGLVNETPYYVWVQAVNAGGESPLSEQTSGIPTNRYAANNSATFQTAVSSINNDVAGEYWITVTGNFAITGILFTSNASKVITIEGDSSIRSISNGNTSTPLFTIPSGIELILGNNITLDGAGKLYPVVNIDTGGTLTMNSGAKISGGKNSGVRIEGGIFIMNDGEISGNSFTVSSSSVADTEGGGGGVFGVSGSFIMSGGTISGNSVIVTSTNNLSQAFAYGGGVFIISISFTMSGGTISNNSVSSFVNSSFTNAVSAAVGGGVFVDSGSFTMSGGTISGNSTSSSHSSSSSASSRIAAGGGVYVAAGTFNKTGGTITDTNSLSPYVNTRGKVAYAQTGSKHRETTAGPTVNLSSTSTTNWE